VTRTIDFFKQNAIAIAALFIALGGTSYAAVVIPRDSVGAAQLRRGAVTSSRIHSGAITPGKLASKSFGGRILDMAEIYSDGAVVLSSPKGITTSNWNADTGGLVNLPRRVPTDCVPIATGAAPLALPAATAPAVGAGLDDNSKQVDVGLNGSTPVALEIVCEH
jgi:hypothetical protein